METVAAWECDPDCPVRLLDEQSNTHGAGAARAGGDDERKRGCSASSYQIDRAPSQMHRFGDTGGASRFFYCAKSSSGERHYAGKNVHSTVKPVDLMRWLCRLVTPPGGLVLDPFAGSGSTGIAALAEGFRFIGIEISPEYATIAKRRIAGPLFSGGDE
jgi:site-specific DNA-methyltransferase (adenine-specific)